MIGTFIDSEGTDQLEVGQGGIIVAGDCTPEGTEILLLNPNILSWIDGVISAAPQILRHDSILLLLLTPCVLQWLL